MTTYIWIVLLTHSLLFFDRFITKKGLICIVVYLLYRNIDIIVSSLIYFSVLIYVVYSFILVENNTVKVISASTLNDIAELYADYIYTELGDNYRKWSDYVFVKELTSKNIVCSDRCSIQFGVDVVIYEYSLTTIDLSGVTISYCNKLVETSSGDVSIYPHARSYRSKILAVEGKLRLLILEVISYVVMN